MLPLTFLASMLALCLFAVVANGVGRRRFTGALQRLAGEWGMRYAEADVFGLAERVASRLPVPGASGLRVADLLYRTEGDSYRYVFTAEFTQGVIRTKTRVQQVATFTEPLDPGPDDDASPALVMAPRELPVIEQYMQLVDGLTARGRLPTPDGT